MLKMRKNLVIVMMIIVICLLGAMSLETKATSLDIDNPVNLTGDLDIITGGDDLNSTNNTTMLLPDTNTTTPINTTTEPINNTPSIIQPVVDNNTENGTENSLPKTGVTEDITVMFFIVVCVVSAIYAYKKIRDYNI